MQDACHELCRGQVLVVIACKQAHELALPLQLIALMVRKGRWELTGHSAHKPKINMVPWIRLASGPALLRFTQDPL
jgi:hypothetical protein